MAKHTRDLHLTSEASDDKTSGNGNGNGSNASTKAAGGSGKGEKGGEGGEGASAAQQGFVTTDPLSLNGLSHASQQWINYAAEHYFKYDADGNVIDATLYHDPLLFEADGGSDDGSGRGFLADWNGSARGGIMPAWYLLPQRPELAYKLYRGAVAQVR